MEKSTKGEKDEPDQNNNNKSNTKKQNLKKLDYGNEGWNEAKKPLHWAR